MAKRATMAQLEEEQEAGRRDKEYCSLQAEGVKRTQGTFFVEQAIGRKTETEDQGNPRKATVVDGEVEYSEKGEKQGKPLDRTHFFPKKKTSRTAR
jgi:hypothetical protein